MENARKPGGVRLQRAMADAGIASRRECEAMISRGEVKLNGKVVTDLPVFVNPRRDTVIVNGRRIELRGGAGQGRAGQRRVYIAVNKPDRTLSTTKDDPFGAGDEESPRGARRTVLDLVADQDLGRLYPVGRLGFHDTGLVLLTNDGDLANRLMHARFGVPRTYVVFVRGRIPAVTLERMSRRLAASLGEGAVDGPAPVQILAEDEQETELEVTLRESPKLRIDALIFEAGLKVKRLVRTAIGPVGIKGIASGNWRFLNRNELEDLMAAAGLEGRASGGERSAGKRGGAGGRRGGGRPARGAMPPPQKRPRRILPGRSADARRGRNA